MKIIESLSGTFQQRINHPFLGSYIVAALFLNWKFFLLILSSLEYHQKLNELMVLYPGQWECLVDLLMLPAAFALFWVFGWPVFNKVISEFWFGQQADIFNKMMVAERKKLISEEMAAELYERNDSIRKNYLDLVAERDREIQRLSRENSEMAAVINSLKDNINDYEKLVKENSQTKSDLKIARSEYERLKERSKDVARYISGVRTVFRALNDAANYSLREDYLKKTVMQSLPSLDHGDYSNIISFMIEANFIKRTTQDITFGGQFSGMPSWANSEDFSEFFSV